MESHGRPLIGNTENKATVPGAATPVWRRQQPALRGRLRHGPHDVFDSAFNQVKPAAWQFKDPRLPKGYRAFNAQTLNGNVFVTYDKADPATGREAVGKGLGVVDEFSTNGRLISRIASGGSLNAPWGLAIAPAAGGAPQARC